MKDLKKLLSIICLFLLTFVTILKPVYAYLDPGTGSLIVQILIGGIVAVGAAIKMYWVRIVGFFSRKENKKG